MSYTVVDKRGQNKEVPEECCRVCGSLEVHTRKYNQPTMKCIEYYREIIANLEEKLKQAPLAQ